MTCIARGTSSFLAGCDSHTYEMYCTTGSGWNNRCRKVCLTLDLGSVIPRWTNSATLKLMDDALPMEGNGICKDLGYLGNPTE